jgi:hypothetical protein
LGCKNELIIFLIKNSYAMASFADLYEKLQTLIGNYKIGRATAEDFVDPLIQLQACAEPMFAHVGYHMPIGVQSSLYVAIDVEKVETWFGYFDLKNTEDIGKFLAMLRAQTVITTSGEEIMVGPNINGYCSRSYTRQYMQSYGFIQTYNRVYH